MASVHARGANSPDPIEQRHVHEHDHKGHQVHAAELCKLQECEVIDLRMAQTPRENDRTKKLSKNVGRRKRITVAPAEPTLHFARKPKCDGWHKPLMHCQKEQ